MGSLVGFGMAYSATSGSWFDPEKAGVSRKAILKWGFVFSWVTVLLCGFGFLKGFIWGRGDDDDR
jgi:hypothetical protein